MIANGNWTGDPSNYFYFFRQIRNIGVALIMASVIYAIPIKFFQSQKNVTIIAI